jgi:diguanylate cyclase (GGDEF)-like protein
MLDLDDLKPVNDTFGHQWGDRLIKAVADVLRQTIRFTDAAARYGGDEFIVLLPETDASGAYIVAETLRRDIASLTLRASERNVRSSVSVGLVTYPQDGVTIEQLVAAADVAMYEAKRRGKNQIAGYRTRTERVATAIDVAAGALVGMGPGGPGVPARVGGDTPPWEAGPPPSATDRPSATERPSARASQPAAPPPAASGGDAGNATAPSPSTVSASPAIRSSASEPTDVLPSPGPSNEAPAWLTRPQPPPPATSATVASATPTLPAGAASVQPDDNARDASQQAHLGSAADRRTGTRDPSRSEEIRRAWDSTAPRPWIALPIDRLDAPDPSDPQAGQVDPPN